MAKKTIKLPRKKEFTIQDCISLNETLNAQTVRSFIRNEIAAGDIEVVGRVPSKGPGRPQYLLTQVS